MGLILRHDAISKFFILLGFSINIYLLTFDVSFSTAFPAFLLLGGLVMQRYLYKRIEEDPEIDDEEATGIAYYTMFALLGIGVGSLFVSRTLFIFPATIQGGTGVLMLGLFSLNVLHGVLMAISEEVFFRGVFLQFFSPLGMGASISAAALIGIIYHLRVYGTTGTGLYYVGLAWVTFGYVSWKTKRLSPILIAHILNNYLSLMGT